MQCFKKSQKKLVYAYLLTPTGIAEKFGLTVRFLAHKLDEFEGLAFEIEILKSAKYRQPGRKHYCGCHVVSPTLSR